MKKIMSMILILMMISTIVPLQKVNAEEINKNLNFIVNNSEKLVYTYSEDNKEYKIEEQFSKDGKSVSSKVYELKNNKYIEIDNFTTSYSDEKVTQKLDNGEVKSFTISENDVNKTKSIYYASGQKSKWVKHSTWKGNNKFTKWSVGAIAIVLSGITGLPATAVVIINLAAHTYSFNAKTVYYTATSYKDTNAPRLRPNFKRVTNIYTNSARTKILKKGVVSYNCSSTCTHN